MREWMEELSTYITVLEEAPSPMEDLSEEIDQAARETDVLLAASDQLQSAFASLIGKIEHANP